MFSFCTTVQPQVTVPLSHLINAFHSLKSSATSVSSASLASLQRDVSEIDVQSSEPVLNLRDLGLSELRTDQLNELVDRLLPGICAKKKESSSRWHTSHTSAQSFYENKHGYPDIFSILRSSFVCRQHHKPLRSASANLQYWPVHMQSRGFKTLKSRARRLQSTSERIADTEYVAPSFMKGLLLRDRGTDVESVDKILKTKNIPEGQHDAFKTGFAEGFLKAQALTQKTNDSLRRTRLILLIILLLGVYGLSKTPFLSGEKVLS